MGPQLNFVNTLWGGECCAATDVNILKGSKLFVRDPAWPVLRLYLNFYEFEMLIERELFLYFTALLNNRQQPASFSLMIKSRLKFTARSIYCCGSQFQVFLPNFFTATNSKDRPAVDGNNRPLSRNVETKDFARLTSHPVRG